MARHSIETKAVVDTDSQILPIDVEQLRKFHEAHFPGQQVPAILAANNQKEVQEDEEDSLGHYADGVKRTLTEEQIKMFRHSEIQRLLSERRQARAQKADEEARQHRKHKQTSRTPWFDDEPGEDKVDLLMYDDEPHVEQAPQHSAQGKFLWPTLGV